MAIKRIPIKGISRDPSGQISAEGMCAESFNVQLDMGEVAPMMRPNDVSSIFVLPSDENAFAGDVLYIHKSLTYENLITFDNDSHKLHYYPSTSIESYSSSVINTVLSGEVLDIVSVGNTLIVSTTDDMYYLLWKNNEYKFLGDRIPIPSIYFKISELDEERDETEFPSYPPPFPAGVIGNVQEWYDWQALHNQELKDWWDEYAPEDAGTYTYSSNKKFMYGDSTRAADWGTISSTYKTQNSDQQTILDTIWGKIDEKLQQYENEGKLLFPVFIRYAIRLYDGTIYAQSIPILLGGDIEKFFDVRMLNMISYSDQDMRTPLETQFKTAVKVSQAYKIVVGFDGSTNPFQDWEDIVTGVDLFMSKQLLPDRDRAYASLVSEHLSYDEGEEIDGHRVKSDAFEDVDIQIDPYHTKDHQEDWLLQNISTFLAKHYDVSEYAGLVGTEVTLNDVDYSSDWLLNQEALIESPRSMHKSRGETLFTYNKRVLTTGVTQELFNGYSHIPSTKWIQGSYPNRKYLFIYYLRGETGENIIHSRSWDTGEWITPLVKQIVDGDYTNYTERLCTWFAYPDSRCYKAEIYYQVPSGYGYNYTYRHTVIMKPCPTLDVAYAFAGFGKSFSDSGDQVISEYYHYPEENLNCPYGDSVLVSKVNNPFIFNPSDILSFSGRVLNLATVTIPLSEGQFGQFPLYVFTKEGVFSVSVNASGDFSASHPVSREILIDTRSLVTIEQGIFFASARGLMLLQGSSVTKVSELMDGHPDSLSNDLAQSIASRFFSGVPINETGPFYQFLNGCRMAYDYANARIILFREEQSDMYVYKFNTQSWHRMAWNPLSTPVRTLNSYPEAYIVEEDEDGKQSLMNYSVLAEEPDAVPLPGLIYTRELSLDEQDIYKTIERLKVRGRYTDGHVKWALQGSNDGVNYRTLHSLRGPSWKWYRIAIVTMLDAQERISYIELDYTPKFTNRLR